MGGKYDQGMPEIVMEISQWHSLFCTTNIC